MKWLKGLVLGLVIAALALVAVSFLLPREVTLARSVEIDAPAAEIFPYLNSHRLMSEWSPWADKDPNAKFAYTGPDSGVGAKLEWQSEADDVGSGTSEIVQSTPDESVSMKLDFGDMGTANAGFKLEPAGESTRVTWAFETDLGNNPIARYFGLMFDKWVGSEYEKGLADLKALVEGKAGG